jgi:fructose transport system permease protein
VATRPFNDWGDMTTTAVDPTELAPPSLARRMLSGSTLGPLAALIVACIIFSILSDQFLSGGNFSLIVQQVMVVGTLAIGQTLIILTAGIDLSNGAIMAFSSILMARLAVINHVPGVLAILIGLAIAAGFGLVNGLLVTRVPLPPFIVTLGMLNIAFALTHIYSKDETVTGVPGVESALGNTFTIGGTRITYGSILMLLLFALFAYLLSQTAWGKHVYAVGNNPEAARLTGIPTRRLLLAVYVIAGFVYGIAALLSIARTSVGDPNAGQTDNLDSITAVVLGGTSLFGGRGSVLGTLIGALIVGVIRNGLTLIGVQSTYQVLITGILVILAVTVDQISRRRTR